ncbi:MAG: hypothetical protein SFV54_20340 [Bryobacteraceae bacterium]|nr:hypothetical protein [Bryobacteraceae bacterium]
MALIIAILADTFEVVVLPRRVRRGARITSLFYTVAWHPWRSAAVRLGRGQEGFLGLFEPLAMILPLTLWGGLVTGFAGLQWALGTPLEGRFLAVAEAAIGFGFLAIVIGYLPVLYQHFSQREQAVALMDARAGSPPSGERMLVRLAKAGAQDRMDAMLADWERWAAGLLESHLSYPVLGYYRSHHRNQSWLSTLVTFVLARHVAADMAQLFGLEALVAREDRLGEGRFEESHRELEEAGFALVERESFRSELAELRCVYEPYVAALGEYLCLPVSEVRGGGTGDQLAVGAAEGARAGFDELRS